jgi:hypothetical protein
MRQRFAEYYGTVNGRRCHVLALTDSRRSSAGAGTTRQNQIRLDLVPAHLLTAAGKLHKTVHR